MNDYGRDDEIGELAASFNNMAERLQQTGDSVGSSLPIFPMS